MTLLPKTEAVLFDLDGTFADTAPDLSYAVNQMRIARGLLPVAEQAVRGRDLAEQHVAHCAADVADKAFPRRVERGDECGKVFAAGPCSRREVRFSHASGSAARDWQ